MAVQQANSGHPGLPLGAAPMAYVLWTRFLRFNPKDPQWPNRDRFVLSAGHGSMLLYSLLYTDRLRSVARRDEAFPPVGLQDARPPRVWADAGVEVSTGPLGQGFGNGVGMAIAEAFLAATYNRPGHNLIDHYTYAIVSDGDLMEGVASEAASLAGHLQLGKLIYLYDDNDISLDGPTSLAFTEDRLKRFDAYGWHTQRVEDGNDLAGDRAGDPSGAGRDHAALADLGAHDYRLRQPAGRHQQSSRQPAWRRKSAQDQGVLWLGSRQDVCGAGPGAGAPACARRARRGHAGRLAARIRGLRRGLSQRGPAAPAGAGRRVAAGLGCRSADVHTCRWRAGDAPGLRQGAGGDQGQGAVADRRLGRPGIVERDADQGRAELPAGRNTPTAISGLACASMAWARR